MELIDDLDRKRVEVQRSVAELEKSVQYWRTWEAEYEGFQEELQSAGTNPTPSKIEELAAEFGGEVFTEAEYSSLIKEKDGTARTASKILDLMRHRLDWFKQNVQYLEKQLDAANAKSTALDAVVSTQARNEDGMPLQEIHEELDDDDNVISSTVSNHQDSPDILSLLKEQGLKGLSSFQGPEMSASTSATDDNPLKENSTPPTSITVSEESADPAPRKSVRFTDEPVVETTPRAEEPLSQSSRLQPTSAVHREVERSLSADLAEDLPLPGNETPGETALRREMLQYNMHPQSGEGGAIVAEMDLLSDDDFSSVSATDEDDEDDSEDEFGRSTLPVITDEYRQDMLEMEQRLSAKYPTRREPQSAPEAEVTELSRDNQASSELQNSSVRDSSSAKNLKSVRFAQAIDVQGPPSSPKPQVTNQEEKAEAPISDSVFERTNVKEQVNEPPKPRAPSRFMAKRTGLQPAIGKMSSPSNTRSISSGPLAGMDTSALIAVQASNPPSQIIDAVPEIRGPSGRTHSDVLVENPRVDSAQVEEPSEFTQDLVHRQLVEEYHKKKTHLIQRNGGFKSDEEDEDESKPKTSRFMAARVSNIKK